MRLLMPEFWYQSDADSTYEPDSLGYSCQRSSGPNVDEASHRSAPVRNSWSFHATCCWPKKPSVAVSKRFWLVDWTAPRTSSVPGIRSSAFAVTVCSREYVWFMPAVVVKPSVDWFPHV